MSQENIINLEEKPLSAEATTVVSSFERLSVQHEDACNRLTSALGVTGLKLNQIIAVLSRNDKKELLQQLELRLESGIRAIANPTKSSSIDSEASLRNLVSDINDIWEKRRD
ncbi:MAG: hypothetical protein V4606_03855 [Patescibacteria group bacterium]